MTMRDIINKLFKGEEICRMAVGKVDGKEIKLILTHGYRFGWIVEAKRSDTFASELEVFFTKHFANKYFEKLLKKYNLKEVKIGGRING